MSCILYYGLEDISINRLNRSGLMLAWLHSFSMKFEQKVVSFLRGRPVSTCTTERLAKEKMAAIQPALHTLLRALHRVCGLRLACSAYLKASGEYKAELEQCRKEKSFALGGELEEGKARGTTKQPAEISPEAEQLPRLYAGSGPKYRGFASRTSRVPRRFSPFERRVVPLPD